jgi:hypothetical protein
MMKKLKFYLTLSFTVIASLIMTMLFTVPVFAAGTITTSPSSGPVGTVATISGTGFTAASTYTINFDSVPLPGETGTITAAGALTATTFIVPNSIAGVHTIQVTTSAGAGDSSNIRQFTVVPAITLSDTTVIPGTTILVNGTGFGASRTVTIYVDSTARTTATTDTTGTFVATLQIPTGAGGTHTVTATDTVLNSDSATYTIAASITLNASSLTVGSQLTVTGANFAASTTVRVYVGSTLITSTTTNSSGAFTSTITVPQGAYGSQTVTATDSASNSANAPFNITPSISVNATTISTGSQITVSGNGFAAHSTVQFYLDNSQLSTGTVSTNSLGSFSANITIPVIAGGNHVLLVRDANVNPATFNFSVTQGITVDPQTGSAGSNIQVTGRGLTANRQISIKLDGANITTSPTTPVTNAGGEFTASFNLPAVSGGSQSVEVSDGTFTFSSTITVNPGANLSIIRGNVGTSVTVTGTSFGSNAAILVTFDGESVASANANVNGAFTATFSVPAATGGNHTVNISDRSRNITFNFSVTTSVVMSPLSGVVGTPITLTGTGFGPQRTLTIKYDTTNISTTTQTDAKGGFSLVFNAPVSKGGNHSVIVSDGTNTITNTFAMDAAAPAVPVVLAPINKNAGTMPELSWQAVNDPSGVTYWLQVARDASFNNLVIEKKGLTSPVYQLTEDEKLESASKNEPYFWHVKAIDGASNESAFSQAQSFYVGFILPDWGLYVIFGAAVVIAFFLGFFLRGSGRKPIPNVPAPPPPAPTNEA